MQRCSFIEWDMLVMMPCTQKRMLVLFERALYVDAIQHRYCIHGQDALHVIDKGLH